MTEPDIWWRAEVTRSAGPHLPTKAEVWAAQDRPMLADADGCTDQEYDRLILERQQTEAAYLAGVDREIQAEAS